MMYFTLSMLPQNTTYTNEEKRYSPNPSKNKQKCPSQTKALLFFNSSMLGVACTFPRSVPPPRLPSVSIA